MKTTFTPPGWRAEPCVCESQPHRYVLEANREDAETHPVFLREKGDKAITKFGPFLKATVRVKIEGKEAIIRDYRMTLEDHAD